MTDDHWRPPSVLLSVDLVILTLRDSRLQALLVERGVEPFVGKRALPGGFLNHRDEGLPSAARRELVEEAGLNVEIAHLEQFGVYGDPGRDPRGRVVTVAYLVIAPQLPDPVAGTDAATAGWVPVEAVLPPEPLPPEPLPPEPLPPEPLPPEPPPPEPPPPEFPNPPISKSLPPSLNLAFDHRKILTDGVEYARTKLEHSSLATAFCAEVFTIPELQQVYEAVWGAPLDPRNFFRKVQGTPGFIAATGLVRKTQGGRPARLFRAGPSRVLNPPMARGAQLLGGEGGKR